MKRSKLLKKILITVTLASILVSSLFCLPSAAVGEDVVGKWQLDVNELSLVTTTNQISFYCNGTINFYTDASSFEEIEFNRIFIQFNADSLQDIQVFFGNGVDFSIYFYSLRVQYSGPNSSYSVFFDSEDFSTDMCIFNINEFVRVEGEPLNRTPYEIVSSFANPYVEPPKPKGAVDKILNVFLDAGNWITSALGTLAGLFWSFELQKLTLLGMLAVIPVGISMMFIFFYMIKGWCQF